VTAGEVVARIDSSWQELSALAAGMDDAGLSAPGGEGWAVKDHLIHVGAWEHWLLALFEHRDKLAAMGAEGANREVDDVNAVVFEKHHHDSASDAREYFTAAHEQLMAVLRRQTTADFERPYSTVFASAAEGEGAQQPVLEAVAANTYDHYADHVKWIRELTESQGRR
jgi:Protein of unknown function (DUF1706)